MTLEASRDAVLDGSTPFRGRRLLIDPRSVDPWSAVLFVGIGVGWFLLARAYPAGTAARMGPGFFPLWVAILLAVVGIGLGAASLLHGSEGIERARLRPVTAVLGSILVFGLAIDRLGLFLTAALLVFIAGQAVPGNRAGGLLALAVGLATVTWLLFVQALGIPLAAFPK